MYPRRSICIQDAVYVSKTQYTYPRRSICIQDAVYVSKTQYMYPRRSICILAATGTKKKLILIKVNFTWESIDGDKS